ncbi:MFS transporter [Cupriavidus necator]|uniref:MFS transporter n=1 Tax=Cupriavidus necator TaxID=106590 RepID=A0A1U9URK6_CUPNE|nr:MFS transporter [Cupriavidus necator]AQV95199.1 MFS transporter [Cupriavidus necator]
MTPAAGAAIPVSETKALSRREISKVIWGSSLGTVFEWYDFFVYGTLAAILGPLFFSRELGETGAFLASLATYGAGLVIRPFGSLVFGRLGDLVGRKYTFLITIILMGVSTAGIGFLPTYETAGIVATLLLVSLRLLQGLALGGEYGGAAIYVAEHVSTHNRGHATGYIQICATAGFFLSLVVVLSTQYLSGPDFKVWGWRVPFILSTAMLLASVYIRSRLNESPVFVRMKAEGRTSSSPLRESFANKANLRLILLSLFGAVAGVGVVWYTSQFYVLIFMQKVLKIDLATSYILMSLALAAAVPFYVVFGWLSDKWGRKPILLVGLAIAALTYVPLFKALTHYGNPALDLAMRTTPVQIASSDCRIRMFEGPQNDCEKVKDHLVANGIPHTVVPSVQKGTTVIIGDKKIEGLDIAQMKAALTAAGYPASADPGQINRPMVVLVIFVLLLYSCACYGPLAAYLVELFPARIRYTSLSMPYHLGTGYFGGFMLYFATLIASATGNIFDGLYYSIAVSWLSVIVGFFLLPETKGRDISA